MLWHLIEAFCIFCAVVVLVGFPLSILGFFALLFYRLIKQLVR